MTKEFKLPKVLIFTATYDGKDYCLEKFLENVSKFTYPNQKHIIIDNSANEDYFVKLKKRLNSTPIEVYRVGRGGTSREAIARAQNFARQKAIDEGFDYLLSLESDIFPPVNFIEKLIIDYKQVVTGMYLIGNADKSLRVPCATVLDFKPEIGMYGTRLVGVKDKKYDEAEIREFMKPGLKQVAAGGMGCCLIRRDVFTKLPFMYEPKMAGHSDIFWFNECHRNKIPVFVDTEVACGHDYSDWTKVKDR